MEVTLTKRMKQFLRSPKARQAIEQFRAYSANEEPRQVTAAETNGTKTTVERDREAFAAIPAETPSDRQVGGGHYTKYEIQPAEYAMKNNIGAYEWQAMQYIQRHQDKGGAEDLRKAMHTIELILQFKYGE